MVLVSAGMPEVLNILVPLKNTEHIIELPRHVKKLLFQTRNGSDLKIAFRPNQSGTNYFTLRGFSTYFEDLISGPITLAVQSAEDNTIIEIIYWSHYD